MAGPLTRRRRFGSASSTARSNVNKEFYRRRACPFCPEILAPRQRWGQRATVDATTHACQFRTSHTARYTPDRVDYYELLDVFRFNYRRDSAGFIRRKGDHGDGVGMATKRLDGKVFVSDVYDGGPAWRASVRTGDEILAAAGGPFDEIGSAGKTGKDVTLTPAARALNRRQVRPEKLQPSEAILDAIEKSVRVTDRRNGSATCASGLYARRSQQISYGRRRAPRQCRRAGARSPQPLGRCSGRRRRGLRRRHARDAHDRE
jgi:hypothetical protein